MEEGKTIKKIAGRTGVWKMHSDQIRKEEDANTIVKWIAGRYLQEVTGHLILSRHDTIT